MKPLPLSAAIAMIVPTQDYIRHFQMAGFTCFTDKDYVTALGVSGAVSKELNSIPAVTSAGFFAEDNIGYCEVAGTLWLPSSQQAKDYVTGLLFASSLLQTKGTKQGWDEPASMAVSFNSGLTREPASGKG